MSDIRRARWFGMSVLLIACSGASSTDAPPPDGTSTADTNMPLGGQELKGEPYVVNAGEEKYFCYTFRSPAEERAITEVEPHDGKLVHHTALFQTMTPEPDGFSECPSLVKATWQPIWAGGRGSPGLKLPANTGFKIKPNTQYLVQYHLLNATAAPVTESSTVTLGYAADARTVTPAGLFALGSFNINIPPERQDFTKSVECNSTRDMKVFAQFPHMHQLGKRMLLETGSKEAPETLYDRKDWAFGDQPMDTHELTISKGQYLKASCTWHNTTGQPVTYGESTSNEMCFLILFYYPFEALDGCLN